MIQCPYCNELVEDEFENKRCPCCSEYVRSVEWIGEIVASRLRHLRRNNKYDKVRAFAQGGMTTEAIEIITNEFRKKDAVLDRATIDAIMIDRLVDQNDTKEFNHYTAQKKRQNSLVTCSACNHKISVKAETCPNCGNPTGVHVCPKCGSTNTKPISGASKATSVFLWGPFAANKVVSKFQCKDCWHKW